jgi:hypothetical protein
VGLADVLMNKIQNVQVGPLIPILGSNIPGSLARDYITLGEWFLRKYGGSILGLREVWVPFVSELSRATDSGALSPTFFVQAMPDSLSRNAKLVPHRFIQSNSRHVISNGIDIKANLELLRALRIVLDRDFGIPFGPGESPVRATNRTEGSKEITHIVLVGASHMRRVSVHLRGQGYTVTEIRIQGTIPSEHALDNLIENLKGLKMGEGMAVILDILGNTVFRFEQADGGLALPIMLAGRF